MRSWIWGLSGLTLSGCLPSELEFRDAVIVRRNQWFYIERDVNANTLRFERVPADFRLVELSFNQIMDADASEDHISLSTVEGTQIPIDIDLLTGDSLRVRPLESLTPGDRLLLEVGPEVQAWRGMSLDIPLNIEIPLRSGGPSDTADQGF